MAHKSVHVIQKPNEKINAIYVGLLCRDFSTYMGAACIHDGKLMVSQIKGAPKPEAFDEVTKAFGSNAIVFTVGKADHGFLDEDMQPFELLKDNDGNTIVCGFFDGKFEGYAVPKSTHTDEYHLVNDVLIPKLKKIYKSVGGGIPELIEELKDPVTTRDFNNMWTTRGNITLFTKEGPVTFSSNTDQKGIFNWGWTSDPFNYKEQTVAKPDKVVEDKPMSMLEKLKAKAGLKTEAAPAEVDPPIAAVTGPAAKASVAPAAIVAVSDDNFETVGLPKEASNWTNKDKIKWWISEVGYKPEGYKEQKTKVKRTKGTKVGVLAPLASTNVQDAASPISKEEIAKEVVKAPEPEMVKDTSVKNLTTAYMPILSPKQKLNLKTSWLKDAEVVKVLGDDFKAAIDPKLLKEFEETYATIWDGLGMENMWLSYEAIVKLGEADLRALAIYAFNQQNEAKKTELRLRSIIADPKNNLRAAI